MSFLREGEVDHAALISDKVRTVLKRYSTRIFCTYRRTRGGLSQDRVCVRRGAHEKTDPEACAPESVFYRNSAFCREAQSPSTALAMMPR